MSIALGFIGALIGMALARALKLPDIVNYTASDGTTFPVVWAIIGSALFVAVIHLISRRRV